MGRVPRELFVRRRAPRRLRDAALPIGHGQTISSRTWSRGSRGARLQPGERVLDVGTGSGYQAAVLASSARDVVTIERIPELRGAGAREPRGPGTQVDVRVGTARSASRARAVRRDRGGRSRARVPESSTTSSVPRAVVVPVGGSARSVE
jgi:protein-L-isoaspartate O-methyltransferase